ncbi:MAG: acyltransferase family protein, partial [Planctomycetaceae bacterium]
VVIVLLFHARLGMSGGYVGVDVFFVISGYLISSLILREMSAGDFSMARFWERRIRRIASALVVVVACTTIVGSVLLLPEDFRELGQSVWAQSMLVSNVYFWRNTGYFAGPAETKPLLHLWSLAVEEQFYILLPLLLIALRRFRLVSMPTALVVLLAGSFAMSVYGVPRHPSATFYLLPTRAWELLLGSVLALRAEPRPIPRWAAELLSGLGLAAILATALLYDSQTPFPGLGALLPCAGTALFIRANSGILTLSGRLMAARPVVFVGLISYSLYLWHWPVLVYAQYWVMGATPASIRGGLLMVSILLAIASWRWVERPFRERRVFAERRSLFYGAASTFLVLLLAGVLIDRLHGVAGRFSAETLAYAAARDDMSYTNDSEPNEQGQWQFDEVGRTNGPIDCLVWGDSHAMAVMPAIERQCRTRNARCVYALRSGTLPLYRLTSTPGFRLWPGAEEFNHAVVDYVKSHRVENVLLAGLWSYVPAPTEGRAKSLERVPPELFREWMLETVQVLQKSGATVWILQQVPAQNCDVPRALARESMIGGDPKSVGVTLAEHRALFAGAAGIIDEMARHGAIILDPSRMLTDDTGFCGAARNGRSLYRDHHNLSVQGALEITPLFDPIFPAKPATVDNAVGAQKNVPESAVRAGL